METPYHKYLHSYWGYDDFRPLQLEIIETVMRGEDCVAILPTGGGKSLGYQIPALASDGICVVVSPLIALMQDQVQSLHAKNIKASMIVSGMTSRQIEQAFNNSVFGDYKLLYVSPERLQSEHFLTRFKEMNVSFIAVDEAHCISEWGFDFRPSYLEISNLRSIHDVPILAMTATATERVKQDVIQQLGLQDPAFYQANLQRKNLSLRVIHKPEKLPYTEKLLNHIPGSSIIYTAGRKTSKQLSDELNLKHLQSNFYHAGLKPFQRKERQDQWLHDQSRIMVATNAFGMGIDKPNVRSVIHYQVPESMEAYYQEAGRAGRDGLNAFALLLVNEKDYERLQQSKEDRYPDVQSLERILIGLFQYLQINFGDGMGKAYPFSIYKFAKRFDLPVHFVFNSLESLVRQGWITINDGFYNPSRVQIAIPNTQVYAFQVNSPQFEPLLKFLLRNYEGIFDQLLKIDEDKIAEQLHINREEVVQKLTFLHKSGIITYYPQNEEPLLVFLKERPKGDQIQLDQEKVNQLRLRHQERIDAIVRYVDPDADQCRMNYIESYFGQTNLTECMVCDVCLRKKKEQQDLKISELQKVILSHLQTGPKTVQDIGVNLRLQPSEVKPILQSLEEEEIVERKINVWKLKK